MRAIILPAACLLVLLTAAVPADAQKRDDPFALPGKLGKAKSGNPTDDRIDFDVKLEPQQARRGETVKLTITGMPRPGFHTYPLTQRTPDQDEIGLSKLVYKDTPGLKALQPVTESNPELARVEGLGTFQLEHKEKFTWVQEILVLPDAKPGGQTLKFSIQLQVCDDVGCVQGEHPFELPLTVSDAAPVALSPEMKQRLDAKVAIQVVPLPGATPPAKTKADLEAPKKAETETHSDTPSVAPAKSQAAAAKPIAADKGLIAFVLTGAFWGFVSLLTPCVFPMIPITVSYFLKQSEKQGHRPVAMASVYSVTIVAVLTLGGVFLMASFQEFSQHWSTQVVLGILFLVFALSLFGMYDLTLPSGLANLTSSQEGRGGLVGTMFMALTFTIISFTCVAPFYGGFIGLSAQSATDKVRLVAGALAFSSAFASPFFVLALFPTLLRSMPKSGSWMNTVKVVMGFLELAAALKFLRAGELVLHGKADLFTYDLVLGMYIAIAVACGLYLLNLYRLPHDHEPVEQLGVPRLLFSLLFLSLGMYLLPGLFKTATGEAQQPNGVVFSWLDSFLLPDATEPKTSAVAAPGSGERVQQLTWLGNLDKGLQDAQDKRRLVFIDFTGLS